MNEDLIAFLVLVMLFVNSFMATVWVRTAYAFARGKTVGEACNNPHVLLPLLWASLHAAVICDILSIV